MQKRGNGPDNSEALTAPASVLHQASHAVSRESALASRRNQRGEGHMKAIIVTIVLVLGVYAAWKLLPPYINDYQLHDKLVEQARYASVYRKTDEELRKIVFQEIQDLGIPARPEDIKIETVGRAVKISVEYSVPVDVLGYHAVLHFTPASENKALT
jgi:hypothetical protein